jgi:predicted ATP-grasp superfamily ATP-dependent carboligase
LTNPEHLAVIYQNKDLPFIFEEANNMGVKVTFFYNSQDPQPSNLPGVSRYIGIDLFGSPNESTETIKKAFQEDPFNGVITLYDPALSFVANVASELNLNYLPLNTISNCRNKNKTRNILRQNGLNTPVFYELSLNDDVPQCDFEFPLVVKPSNGFSSQGVVRVDNLEDLKKSVNDVKEINTNELDKFTHDETKVIIEQFIDGPEFAIESFSIQGEVYILSIGYKGDAKGPYFEEGVYIAPAQLDEAIKEEIIQEVKNTIRALGIVNGPSHTELRLHQGRTPYVIEVGTRIGGSGISHYIVKESTGINYMQLAIKSAFKELNPSDIPPKTNQPRVVGNYIIPIQGSGIFEGITGLDKLKDKNEVKRVLQFIKRGTKILPYPYFSGYPGFILTSHDSYEECEDFYKRLDNEINIIYSNGIPV